VGERASISVIRTTRWWNWRPPDFGGEADSAGGRRPHPGGLAMSASTEASGSGWMYTGPVKG
jgi:hypothetical protein